MPKAVIPRTPVTRAPPVNVASKQAQRKANGASITVLLHEIRLSAGLGRSFECPALNADEYCPKKPAMFTGHTKNVNSSNHPHFSRLGQLYYKVCINDFMSGNYPAFGRFSVLAPTRLYGWYGISS